VKIAIITRSDDRSPKVLALGLQDMLHQLGVQSDIFFETGMLMRLQPWWRPGRFSVPFIKKLYRKYSQWRNDHDLLGKLQQYDAVILSECTPNAFWKNYYNIEKLRAISGKPVLLYEVYYLGNAPTQMARLQAAGDPGIERFDWHFAVTEVTELRSVPAPPWSAIGLNLRHTGLKPHTKPSFSVLVDFAQPGYEQYRREQLQALEASGISYKLLEGTYSMDEIRELYRQCSALLIQFPEAFGLPIAECLATGAYIITPSSAWPMSWRLDEQPGVHTEGELPSCFKVYHNVEELEQLLSLLQQNHNPQTTPFEVFENYIQHYPQFYKGDAEALKQALQQVISKAPVTFSWPN
jgi:hypothetical protein